MTNIEKSFFCYVTITWLLYLTSVLGIGSWENVWMVSTRDSFHCFTVDAKGKLTVTTCLLKARRIVNVLTYKTFPALVTNLEKKVFSNPKH